MGHINDLLDFTISAFIVNNDKILLIHHKKLNKWLPIGGHIEINENPDEAFIREVREETGLKVKILSNKSKLKFDGVKFLYTPEFIDVHDISNKHQHVGLIYFAIADSQNVILAEKEHNATRWFSLEELKDSQYNILKNVIFYSEQALLKSKKNKSS